MNQGPSHESAIRDLSAIRNLRAAIEKYEKAWSDHVDCTVRDWRLPLSVCYDLAPGADEPTLDDAYVYPDELSWITALHVLQTTHSYSLYFTEHRYARSMLLLRTAHPTILVMAAGLLSDLWQHGMALRRLHHMELQEPGTATVQLAETRLVKFLHRVERRR